MRILLTTDSFPPDCGGSGWSTYEVAQGLRSRGHAVSVLRPTPATTERRTREYHGFAVDEIPVAAPNVPFVRNYFKNEHLYGPLAGVTRSVIEADRVDIVHAQHVMSGPASIAAAHAAGRPVVCTVRDYWPVCYWSDLIYDYSASDLCPACTPAMMSRCVRPRAGSLWPLALPMIPYMRANLARKRLALSEADAIVAVSSTLASDLRARAPEVARTRLEIIPNPIDFTAIDAEEPALRRSPPPLTRRYVLYAGKLAPNKGGTKLLVAIRRADLRMPVVFVGDGPDRASLEAEATSAGLDALFTGWLPREEVWRWMVHAGLLAFPSHGPESLSRVLLEASALGVPIAAMDTGGTRDIIVPDRTGLLSRDIDGLARDLSRLANDPALAATLGESARRHAHEMFDARIVVDRLERLYRDLL
ncbi:MAG: glycosyltransferase family 4 protein [Acidobacteria bacterium]|nr:glycosyltransferase family 4 protein [Acidobacteriota bacterium]MBI3263988.1 glycosyltransferase family 4 protein [Acidobacteriota bacterium]